MIRCRYCHSPIVQSRTDSSVWMAVQVQNALCSGPDDLHQPATAEPEVMFQIVRTTDGMVAIADPDGEWLWSWPVGGQSDRQVGSQLGDVLGQLWPV